MSNEKENKFPTDVTLHDVFSNTISMCITGCMAARGHNAENSRVATQFVLGSVGTYLENYVNDYTVDLFLDNIHAIMRDIFANVTKKDSEKKKIRKSVAKVATKMYPHLDGVWQDFLCDIIPGDADIYYKKIELLEFVDYLSEDIIQHINSDLLMEEDRDSKVVYENEGIRVEKIDVDSDLGEGILEFIKQMSKKNSLGEDAENMVNHDTKEIGDIVRFVHPFCTAYTLNSDKVQNWKKGDPLDNNVNSHLINKKAIVIGVNENVHYKCNNCDDDHTADLKIHFEHDNSDYYVSSIYVELGSNITI